MSLGTILEITIFTTGFIGIIYLLGSLFSQRFRKIEDLNEIDGFKYFRCGGQFDWYNLTYPLVKFGLGKDSIYLKYSSFESFIDLSELLSIDEYNGLVSKGVKIQHSHPNITKEFILWTPYSQQLLEILRKKIS